MLSNSNQDLNSFPSADFDWPWNSQKPENNIFAHEFSTSGGFSDHIFRYAAKELFGMDVQELNYKNLRNPDFREISLEQDGKCLLKFAIANGFRNIQNLVQKLKRGKIPYQFVEVMACPSGCINGGAQVRPEAGQPLRELTQQLEQLYAQLPKSNPENNETKQMYNNFFDGQHTDKAKSLLHTSYHAVEKMNTALNIKW